MQIILALLLTSAANKGNNNIHYLSLVTVLMLYLWIPSFRENTLNLSYKVT